MGKTYIKPQNTFRKLGALAAGLSLVFALLLPGPLQAYQTGGIQEASYIIQLEPGQQENALEKVGHNVKKRFAFSEDPRFAGVYTFSSDKPLEALRDSLYPHFVYLEQDRTLNASDVYVNDPGFTTRSEDIDKQWGLARAGFNQGWKLSTGMKKNVVAIIDTGIDGTHEDLQEINFVSGFDFVSRQDINGNINSDNNGHGTLVAGILGASANNGIGITGANWLVSIMPLKALDEKGKGESSMVSEAIVWAADHGANFINLSVGGVGFGHDSTLANAISYAYGKGLVIVAAAGNDSAATGTNLDNEPVYPICDDNNQNMIIGVAATDHNDLKPPFSNYGKNCIDVAAPGKRILSTINYDPLTKKPSPNSYAYASGTSVAVPFVVGQAALIRALNPTASNTQIRDIVISTADSVDNMNLVQCGGNSCKGLLGTGRINVPRSLEMKLYQQSVAEGELVKSENTNAVYMITGGQKRLVSPFVLNQQFLGASIKQASAQQLSNYPEGPYVTPKEGTLVKYDSSPTVFYISNGKKLPVTYQVFMQRNFNFTDVKTLGYPEMTSWVTGKFLAPNEGTLIKSSRNKTVYWVVSGVLHPINYGFYVHKGLNVFPILTVSEEDISGYPKGEAYIR